MNIYDEFINPAIYDWYENGSIRSITNCKTFPNALNGGLVDKIIELNNGTLWLCSDNLATQINYCPITGKKAEVQIHT